MGGSTRTVVSSIRAVGDADKPRSPSGPVAEPVEEDGPVRTDRAGPTETGMIETGFEAPMRRALELAALGPEHGVNPRVGCVILSPDGEVLAEGWHRGAGTAHAEVDALSRLVPGQAS